MSAFDILLAYHQRTKHAFHRFAPGPGYLDWATQPDPFRTYVGAPRIPLTRIEPDPDLPPFYDELFNGQLPIRVDLDAVGQLFFHSFAISARKAAGGSEWALRCNPSSGNLHPTEAYLLTKAMPGLSGPGLYHYSPKHHALEVRARFSPNIWSKVVGGLGEDAMLVGLTSIFWRESWKYGERALRYCLLDLGHAFAALSFSAAALGWRCALLPDARHDLLARLLGVASQHGPEAEHPDCLVAIFPRGQVPWSQVTAWRLDEEGVAGVEAALLPHPPNRLSSAHRAWSVIDEAAAALDSSPGWAITPPPPPPDLSHPVRPISARWLFRKRRSAREMDGRTPMPLADFIRLLRRLAAVHLPVLGLGTPPGVHPIFFVHRVTGLEPGIYFLPRSEAARERFEAASDKTWEWTRPASIPSELPFYRLFAGDVRRVARDLACTQNIAADGAFAVAMLAEFESRLRQNPREYARLHMEAGALGQLLYLEAEAAGLQGTGIGCFFDDPTHQLLGLTDFTFQTIYHFTVGRGLPDPRILTLPAYSD